jgi:hypothetical protein
MLLSSGVAAAVATCPLGNWEVSETMSACKDAGPVFDATTEAAFDDARSD